MTEITLSRKEYSARINKTFDYIESNIDKSFTLDELASIAGFSKFHFNRIFHALVGETPFQFVMRIRLEKAASLILNNRSLAIKEIAYKFGFSDISVFSRSFRNYYKISATLYRKAKNQNSNLSQQQSKIVQQDDVPEIYFCPELKTIKWRTSMKTNKSIDVKELPAMTVAYVRNIGPYDGIPEWFGKLRNKLFSWAMARGLMQLPDCKFLVVYHDDPNVALSNNLRMSLCLTVPSDTKVDGDVGLMTIEATKYVVARFELRGEEFQLAWDWVYAQWMPNSGFQPADKPCFEMYAGEPQNGNYVIDICVPIQPL